MRTQTASGVGAVDVVFLVQFLVFLTRLFYDNDNGLWLRRERSGRWNQIRYHHHRRSRRFARFGHTRFFYDNGLWLRRERSGRWNQIRYLHHRGKGKGRLH